MSHLLSAPRGTRGSALQEERNVRSKLRGERLDLLVAEVQLEQATRAEQESRGIATSAAETRGHRNALRQSRANRASRRARSEELPRLAQDVGPLALDGEPARGQLERGGGLEEELVFEGD